MPKTPRTTTSEGFFFGITGITVSRYHGYHERPKQDRLADNGDGTYTLTVDLAGDPLLDVLDAQHLLFTGSGYTVEEIFFAEDVWIDGPGDVEVKVPVWTNGGTLGEINWGGDYRFAPESNSTGGECHRSERCCCRSPLRP